MILDGTDYENIKSKRVANFKYISALLGDINKINPLQYFDEDTVPMVYPLVVEDDELLSKLQNAKHFQGHWWSYLLNETKENEFEKFRVIRDATYKSDFDKLMEATAEYRA